MRISFERTGGFGNVPLRAEIDTEKLPSDRKQELERLVEQARPFDQPSQSTTATPDDYQYEVKIEDSSGSKTIRTTDSAAKDELKLLFDGLGEEALRKLRS